MKALTSDSLLARLLGKLAATIIRHRRWFFFPQVVLFVACILYTVKFLEFDTSRNNLVGPNKKYHQNFLTFKKEFPTQDDLAVVVESEDDEKNRQFVERLGAKLEAETNLFTHVFFKGDLKMLGPKALLLVPDEAAPTVSAGSIRDPASLAAKLHFPSNAICTYLRSRLSAETQKTLANEPAQTADYAPLLRTLTNDLNQILAGDPIFEAERFSGVALRAKTQELLARHPTGEELARLNRLLLEDAFPEEISRSDLEELRRTLSGFRPFLERFTQATNLVTFFDMVNWQFGHARREKNAETESLIKALPALERIVRQASSSLYRLGAPPSSGVTALFDAGEEAQQQTYITFDNGRIYLLTAQALREELNGDAVDRLRTLLDQTRLEVPGLNVGLTGEPVLERDEMLQSQKDTTMASVVSLILCALIFIYGYQETGRPVKATICLVAGLAYTMAFATATVGHLNILTITFVPMLIGLAIDFGVHLVTRYEEELRHGRSEEEALTKAMVFTGQGIFTGAFTTAGAFLAMSFTNFKGIQEMGVICGGGLVICLIPMMTLLPVLLLRGRQNVIDHQLGDKLEMRVRIERMWLRRPVFVTVMTILFCAAAATQFPKVYFDYNLLNMQSAGLPAVEFERKLINASSSTSAAAHSVLFGAVIANSPEEAADFESRLKALKVVAGVDSISQFINENQTSKLPLIGEIKRELAGLRFLEPDPAPVNLSQLSVSLYSLHGYLGAVLQEIGNEEPELRKQCVAFGDAIVSLRSALFLGTPVEQEARAAKLGAFQRALFNDVRGTFEALRNQDDRGPMRVKVLPPALRDRFVGVTGKYLLQVYPRKDVWQRDNQREFIRELRQSLDPDDTGHPIITGTPVQLYEYTTLLKHSYEMAAWYSLGAIVILVLVHFRAPGSVFLALLPVLVGSIWLGGLMGLCHIPFNPANIMTLPLVIGIGVTNGIHILNRFAEERQPDILARSTGKAVLVSGLTTIAGFGSLVLAEHQGIESLGYVMATGTATCMIAGLTFLPALVTLLMRWGNLIKQPSADNARSTLGREEPR